MNGSERGSEIVQFVVAVPLLLFAVFIVVQVGGMTLAASQVSSELSQAGRRMDAAGLARASDKEAFVKAEIVGAATQLRPDRLRVERVRVEDGRRRFSSDRADGMSIEQRTSSIVLSYDVFYDLPSMLDAPGLSNQTLRRHVRCEIVSGKAVEVEVGET